MSDPETTHAHAQSKDTHETTIAHPGGSANRISIRIDANALSIVALVLSVGVLVAVLMLSISIPQITDAKIQAGSAQAERTAAEARSTAKVTEDKLYELRDALNAKGMNLPKLDGH